MNFDQKTRILEKDLAELVSINQNLSYDLKTATERINSIEE